MLTFDTLTTLQKRLIVDALFEYHASVFRENHPPQGRQQEATDAQILGAILHSEAYDR